MSEDFRAAFRYACKLLSYRQRSVKELSERLENKGFSRNAVLNAVERLQEAGYLDDSKLALSLKMKAQEAKLLGRAGARQYLLQMGVPREQADEALADYDELQSAMRLIERKTRALRGSPDYKLKRRIADILRRRGYSAETVRKSLGETTGII